MMRNPIQLLKDAYGVLEGRWGLFGAVVLVPAILAVLAGLFAYSALGGLLSLAFGIASIFMSIALILVVSGRETDAKAAYKAAVPFFWRYFAVSILVGIAVTIGLVLLVIPGVILAVLFAFSTLIVVLEGKGIIDSIKGSKEYVKGKWWAVFGRLVLLLVLVIVLAAVFGSIFPKASTIGVAISNVVSVLIAPYALAYVYSLYQDVKNGSTVKVVTETPAASVPNTTPLPETPSME